MTPEANRFEGWLAVVRQRRLATAATLLGLLLLVELSVAWGYVAKRLVAEQPARDLVERFHVVRPTRHLFFASEYTFPPVLTPFYAGDLSNNFGLRAIFEADSRLGHRYRPSTLTTDPKGGWYGVNSQGFIISDREHPLRTYQIPTPESVFRIIILGGSTVAGNGASGSLNSLPAYLGEFLNANRRPTDGTHRRFEVINAGVGGYYSDQEFRYYYLELRKYQPDLVIIYDGWNDMLIQNSVIEDEERGEYPRTSTGAKDSQILNSYYQPGDTAVRATVLIAQRAFEFLDGFASLHTTFRAVEKLFAILRQDATPSSGGSPEWFFSALSVQRYVDNISLFLDVNRRDDVPTAWFLQPLLGLGDKPPNALRERAYIETSQPNIRLKQKFYAEVDKSMTALAESVPSNRLCAASLVDVFDNTPDAVYADFGHLYDNGNAIVAERIAVELLRCGLVQRQ